MGGPHVVARRRSRFVTGNLKLFVKFTMTSFKVGVGEMRCEAWPLLFSVAGFSINGAEHQCTISRL